MVVYYIYDWSDYPSTKEWQIFVGSHKGLFLFHSPSECRMFIPGTYAEMMKDYE